MTTPATGLRERKKIERRKRILTVSRVLFDRDGFEATSMEGIAAAVDVSVGTIYKFFPTKIDILSGVLREELEAHMAATPPVTARTNLDPQEGVYRLLEQELLALERLPKNYMSLITAHALATGQTTETGRIYAATDQYLRDEVHSLLLAYQEKGAILPAIDIKPMSDLIFSMANGEHLSWLAGEYSSLDHSLAKMREFLAIIFAGVAALNSTVKNGS
jgi:AcrR family transcriptional regulator